jgi:hypothetical protein
LLWVDLSVVVEAVPPEGSRSRGRRKLSVVHGAAVAKRNTLF